MCITHSPKALKEWKKENKNKQYVYVYKTMRSHKNKQSASSILYSKYWKAGIHEENVWTLDRYRRTGGGLYVYLINKKAKRMMYKYDLKVRFIAKPDDIVYMNEFGAAVFKRLHLTQKAIDKAYKERDKKKRRK